VCKCMVALNGVPITLISSLHTAGLCHCQVTARPLQLPSGGW
jgi:hypothetical protein